jgi:4'-phosphopantetheinyl transferase EntD
MDTEAILRAWREILPASVYINAGPLLEHAPPLSPTEWISAQPTSIERLRELETGRAYAKRALAMISVYGADLPIGTNRAPLWPPGIVGSITHVTGRAGGHIAAAVSRTGLVNAIGIDAENENGLHPRIWDHVLTARELDHILALPPNVRAIEAQIVWCAKEAVKKADGRPIEPTEVEIEWDRAARRYTAKSRPTGVARDVAQTWYVRTMRSQGYILAAAVGMPA